MSAVRYLQRALERWDGALLCDAVGLGKTYVALALARGITHAAVVAPAALKPMWHSAMAAAAVTLPFFSFEALSRGAALTDRLGLIIVDEAHHARTRKTVRYARLTRACANSRVLLLSATPIHNSRSELESLLSLFLGSRAASLSDSDIAECVLRREADSGFAPGRFPALIGPEWLHVSADAAIPHALLDLAAPVPPRAGGDGGALIARALIRQWASSEGALAGALRRRLARTIALESALESGRYPSMHELSAWSGDEQSVQLAFAPLISPLTEAATELLARVRLHATGLRAVQRLLDPSRPHDLQRVEIIRGLRASHRGDAIVAFSQYADTIRSLFTFLRADAGVAALTACGASVAGGRITRAEALARFAPIASGVLPPRRSEKIELLLTTDLLSEGVNLQDASVVIHLDMPWTPARLEQRIGRIARLGSPHDRVFAYAFRPPASSELIIGLERTIRRKMREAAALAGEFSAALPRSSDTPEPLFPGITADGETTASPAISSPPADTEAIRITLCEWARASASEQTAELRDASVSMAAMRADACASLALIRAEGCIQLIAEWKGKITAEPAAVRKVLELASSADPARCGSPASEAVSRLQAQLRSADVLGVTEPQLSGVAQARRDLLTRIEGYARSARPHERAAVALLCSRARRAALGRLSRANEEQLMRIAQSSRDDWLIQVARAGTLPTAGELSSPSTRASVLLAVLVLDPRFDVPVTAAREW